MGDTGSSEANVRPEAMVIFYVADIEKSKSFYKTVFAQGPVLDVPGMTSFEIPGTKVQLGLMSEEGGAQIVGDALPHPSQGNGIPRAELYLFVASPEDSLNLAVRAGGKLVRSVQAMPWGDVVGYASDPDGNVLAFSK